MTISKNVLTYQVCDSQSVPRRMIEEGVTSSPVIDEDHHDDRETSKRVQTFDSTLLLLGAFFKLITKERKHQRPKSQYSRCLLISSVARGGARGHSHPPNQPCFVLDRNGFFLIRLIKKNSCLFAAWCTPNLKSWLRHCVNQLTNREMRPAWSFLNIRNVFTIRSLKKISAFRE